MLQRLKAQAPQARIDGFSVQEMVRGEAEVIIGVRRDPQFGLIVIVGLGGVAVEIMKDVAVATAPVSRTHTRKMFDNLKTAPLFKGAARKASARCRRARGRSGANQLAGA